MSIFSKVKSVVKKVASKAKGVAKGVISSIGSLGKANTAGAGNAFPSSPNQTSIPANQTLAPNISTPFGAGQTQPGGSTVILNKQGRPTGQTISSGGAGQTQFPRTISSGSVGGTPLGSPIYSAPITLGGGQPRLFGGTSLESTGDLSSMSLQSSPSSFGSINSQSTAPSPSISLPSAPGVANPGVINNGGLIGALAETQTYDPNTNSFMPIVPGQDQSQEGRIKLEDMIRDIIPKKENVYEDPDVRRQNEVVRQRQQEVANYTAQLNSVVAQQNADLLRLRGIGSQEGVTETVYGGQQATINREAAIKALPIQAQIAAAQGNLELAQDYLTQLTTWKTEAIDNDYNHRKEIYSSVRNFVDKEEKRQLDKIEKQSDRAYQEGRDLISEQDYWVRQAVENGQAGLITRINNTRSRQELGNVVSAMSQSNGTNPSPAPNAPKLTPTQLNTGSSLLGVTPQEYRALPAPVQTFFTGSGGKAFIGALGDIASGESTWEDVAGAISSSIQPQEVKTYMKKILNSVAKPTAYKKEDDESVQPAFFQDAWAGLKGVFR